MSDMWMGTMDMGRVGPRTVAPSLAFVPWARRFEPAPASFEDEEEEAIAPSAVIDPEAIALDGFARGFEEGRRSLEAQLAEERADLARLAASLAAAQPQPPAALATLIGETVGWLVRQIVGEAEVDADLLRRRAEAAAALVAEEARPARMRVHPDDAVRLADAKLSVELVPDAGLRPGSIVIECRDGWIEDGPEVALERLHAQLAALAMPH